jgi:DNA modification methylase
MQNIPDKSIDMILCDLPYGITDCKWDNVIPFEPLWKQYKRILKINGIAVLFGNQPFTTKLIGSNLKEFSHVWYWKKQYITGALSANKMPLRCVEDICVFICNKPSTNNEGLYAELRQYFFDELQKSGLKRKDIDKILNNYNSSHYFTWGQQFRIPTETDYKKLQLATGCFKRPYDDIQAEYNGGKHRSINGTYTYNPQGVRDLDKPKIKIERGNKYIYGSVKPKIHKQTKTGFPKNLLEINGVAVGKNRLHPTQKPVELLEYLIKTYTNTGEIVLDNCMGSGSTGIAALNTGRKFIGIEKDRKYFDVACNRFCEWYMQGERAV